MPQTERKRRGSSIAKRALLVLALAGTPNFASGQTASIRSAAQQLTNLAGCQERLWPGFSLNDFQIVFLDSDGSAVMWNDKSASILKRSTLTEWKSHPFQRGLAEGFTFTSFNGAKTVLIHPQRRPAEGALVALAVHEIFHSTSQAQMPKQSQRGVHYPEDGDARYSRYELIKALLEALDEPGGDGLDRAAYWRKHLLQAHPRDVEITDPVDLREGTAEFVGRMAASLGQLGCDAPTESLLQATRNEIPPMEFLETRLWGNKDLEAYLVGLITGLLSEQARDPKWKDLAASGGNPLDHLLAATHPAVVTENADLKTRFIEEYARFNDQLRSSLDRFKRRVQSNDYSIVAVPHRLLTGSATLLGDFVSSDDTDVPAILTGYSAQFAPAKGSLTVEGIDVSDKFLKLSADGEFYTAFPVENSALASDELGELSIVSDRVNGSSLNFYEQSVNAFGVVKRWILLE